jgi:hypothetical protein
MLLTAKEAATKWCPQARLAGYLNGNRVGDDPSGWPKCIADGCMLWEWRRAAVDPAQRKGLCGLRERA